MNIRRKAILKIKKFFKKRKEIKDHYKNSKEFDPEKYAKSTGKYF